MLENTAIVDKIRHEYFWIIDTHINTKNSSRSRVNKKCSNCYEVSKQHLSPRVILRKDPKFYRSEKYREKDD